MRTAVTCAPYLLWEAVANAHDVALPRVAEYVSKLAARIARSARRKCRIRVRHGAILHGEERRSGAQAQGRVSVPLLNAHAFGRGAACSKDEARVLGGGAQYECATGNMRRVRNMEAAS